MRRAAFFTMAALSGITAFGQNLLDCVEPDVLRALLAQGPGQVPPTITGEVPQELSALKMPAGFSWIGSAERITGRVNATTNASQVGAAWRSSMAPETARRAAAEAMTASGWEVRPAMGTYVFNPSMPVMQMACREGGLVNLSVNAMEGATYVLATFQRGNPGGNASCNQPSPMPPNASGLIPHLPKLEISADPGAPADVRIQNVGMSIGSNSSSVHAKAEFMTSDSVGDIARNFSRQMAAQGWTRDAEWSGASTAGSSWSKRPEAGALMQGTLSVSALDERQLVAVLRVSTLQ